METTRADATADNDQVDDWVTQREAAELLGVHMSLVPKLVRRGKLTPRRERPSLERAQVLRLVEARRSAAADREARRAPTGPQPPDEQHMWLPAPAAAAVMGSTAVALNARARRGRVPSTVHDHRRWYRLDLLELLLAAQAARDSRAVRR